MSRITKLKSSIPRNVWFLSFISLFNDTASEMLYPVMPIFLTHVLGAPVFVVGLIEGTAEGSAAIFKTIFGYLSDKLGKRKPFVVAGYGASAVSKLIIAAAYAWPIVFLGRFTDRFGKGLRTGARDALLLEATTKDNKGFIFGFHRSMDTAGAVIGPIIALVLLKYFGNDIRLILYIAAVPAFLGIILFIFVKEAKTKMQTTKTKLSLSITSLPKKLQIFILGLAIFSLGNSSDAFLILRAKGLGLSLVLVISAYILYNLVYALASTPAGEISDRIGAKKVFILGTAIFAAVYLGFALNINPKLIWPLFAVYGFYIALTDGVSKAIIGGLVQKDQSATAYGVVTTVTSFFTLLSSVIGGFLWSVISPAATFYFAAICALVSIPIFLSLKD